MTAPRIGSYYYPTTEDVVDLYLRTIRVLGRRNGITLNTAEGSDYWIRAKALAAQIVPAFANNKLAREQTSPRTAIGDRLTDEAAMRGVDARPGARAQGSVLATGSASVTFTIPESFRGTAPNGALFEVREPATIVGSGTVKLRALTAGTAGNLQPGTVVTWDDASLGYLHRTAIVDGGGIAGGTDDDTEEEVRARLLARLRAPAVGGNWSHIRQLALDATSSVARAFVYPAVRGPGTVDVCIIGEDGAALSDAVCDEVHDAIATELGEHLSLSVTSAEAEEVDAIYALSLPLPVNEGGSGGGWVDGSPWPTEPVRVTAQLGEVLSTSATSTAGVGAGSHVAVLDGSTIHRYTVSTASVVGGFVDLAVTPAPEASHVGAYLSADCEQLGTYAQAVVDAFAALGPGEKTTSPALLPRARRRPPTDQSDHARAGHRIETAVFETGGEVADCKVVSIRRAGTTTEQDAPTLPSHPAEPPRRLALASLAFVADAA